MADHPISIQLFNETSSSLPLDQNTFQKLAEGLAAGENCSFRMLEAVIVGEERILKINQTYLEHDYVTDIITFRYDEGSKNNIEGTLYCCWPRIQEQADEYGETAEKELKRVLLHGLLHLVGYKDDTDEHQSEIRAKENQYLKELER